MPNLIAALRTRLNYDEATGALTWASDKGRAKAGARAEYVCTNGYLGVAVTHDGKRHRLLAHRVAWALKTGAWPLGVVDHEDRDKANNSWANLRDCTQSQNTARKRVSGRELPRGVTFAGHTNKSNPYMAQCRSKCVGYFSTPELASEAYEKAFEAEFSTKWRF